MEPQNSKAYSGGAIDKWYAPNITSDTSDPAQGKNMHAVEPHSLLAHFGEVSDANF